MARTSRTGTRTDLALLGAALAVAFASLILPTGVRGKVQGSLRSSIAAPLVSAQAWAERGRQAIGDHRRLVTRVDSLSLNAQASEALRLENDRLRSLLGLGQRLGWGFVASELIHPPRGADEHTVLLAAGSSAGVRPFSPVMVPEGLVGMVTTVDASSSTAILWTHPDFRASATTNDGLAFGIVAAHLGAGADRFLLEMRGVPFRSELKAGTLIVSSGLGNVFPRGIPIGTVLRETKTVEGWARTYLIRPIVSPDAATAAMILLPPRAAAGVTGAWVSSNASDELQKGIAAAGDSLLADSVRVVQARLAKLALLDSLRRAAIYRGDSGVRVESDSAGTARPVPAAGTAPAPAVSAAQIPPKPVTTPAPAPVGAVVQGTTVAPATRATPPAPTPATTGAVAPAPRAAVVTAPARSAAGAVVPPATRTVAAQTRDTTPRVRAAQGAPRPRRTVDSAQARNRRRDTVKVPENPFRLPPAGGRE